MDKIALFPLSRHVLPGGRLELQIIENRFIRMVKECFVNHRGFAMCMLDELSEKQEIKTIPAVATLVHIIDFDALEGGILSITVEGQDKIRLTSVQVESDGLMMGHFAALPAWSPADTTNDTARLAEKLRLFYSSLPELSALYQDKFFNDITWVCQRWIEILPIEAAHKQILISQNSPELAIRFLIKLLDDLGNESEIS